MILDKELTGEKLFQEIYKLLNDREKMIAMGKASQELARPQALAEIVHLCLDTGWK